MKEGFYSITYAGVAGAGFAILVLDTGTVVGGEYDGTYEWNNQTQLLNMEANVKIPEGVSIVQGLEVAPPGGLEFHAQVSFPRNADGGVYPAETDYGRVGVHIKFIRPFPE